MIQYAVMHALVGVVFLFYRMLTLLRYVLSIPRPPIL
jgi:hypothetical protein